MPARTISRRSLPITFAASQTQIVQLPKTNNLREIVLKLSGAPTLLAANNTVANTKRGDEWAVLKNVKVVSNSSETMFEMSGNDLWWLNFFMTGNAPFTTPGLGDGATANPAFESVLIIPFWAYRARKPSDSIFQTGAVNDFRIELTWGDFTDINATATAWTTNPSIEVQVEEVEPSGYVPPFITRYTKQTVSFAGVQNAARIPLDIGPSYRALQINVLNSAGDTDTPGLISNVRLMSGGIVLREYSEKMLFQSSIIRGDCPTFNQIASTGINSRSNGRVSAKNDPRAQYFMNLCLDGYLTEAVQSSTFNELYLEFITTNSCIIQSIGWQVFPNAAAGAKK